MIKHEQKIEIIFARLGGIFKLKNFKLKFMRRQLDGQGRGVLNLKKTYSLAHADLKNKVITIDSLIDEINIDTECCETVKSQVDVIDEKIDTIDSKVDIITNTTRLNNEIIKQRIGCIPIHIDDNDFPYQEYVVEVNKQNYKSGRGNC